MRSTKTTDIDLTVLPNNGELKLLIRFDRYDHEKGPQPCYDCAAKPGAIHEPGCDTEMCSVCGGQALSGCVHIWALCCDEDPDNEDLFDPEYSGYTKKDYEHARRHDPSKARWTGVRPGALECIKLGLFCWENSGLKNPDFPWWNPCGPDHPEARPDLNTLAEHQAKQNQN